MNGYIQLLSIVFALPLMPVLIIIVISLQKWVKEGYGELLERKVAVLPAEAIKKPV